MLPDAFAPQIEAVWGAHARSITLSGAYKGSGSTKPYIMKVCWPSCVTQCVYYW